LQKIFSLAQRVVVFLFLLIGMPVEIFAQPADTLKAPIDSLQKIALPATVNQYQTVTQALLSKNIFLNSTSTPVAMQVKLKKGTTKDDAFYLLMGLTFLIAIIKFFFQRYFNTLFRVFFNTTLRQSQLTDQLLQAKLPSLFFNIFFIVSGGIYTYFLLHHYGYIKGGLQWLMLMGCVFCLGLIYLVKYSSLKFTGWVTGYSQTTDTYIFIIFLINKIIGILVIPFTVCMVFAANGLATAGALISILLISFFLLMRFFRSYGLLQNQLKISKFHFFLYLVGVEIIPLLLIYKGLLLLLSKNL
jgi:Domain of unknown function (DUF4271)